MPDLELIIGHRNYSSWSMRPGVLLRASGLAFRETLLPFSPEGRVVGIEGRSPTGKVPALWIDGVCVWESLAICEAVAELVPEKRLWPTDPVARRVARSAATEMHASFVALRKGCPMDLRASRPDHPRSPEIDADVARIDALWSACRERFGGSGPMLFGHFTCADAMFAPVATRFRTYHVPLSPVAQAYSDALLAHPAVADWIAQAATDTDVLPRFEPAPPAPAKR